MKLQTYHTTTDRLLLMNAIGYAVHQALYSDIDIDAYRSMKRQCVGLVKAFDDLNPGDYDDILTFGVTDEMRELIEKMEIE